MTMQSNRSRGDARLQGHAEATAANVVHFINLQRSALVHHTGPRTGLGANDGWIGVVDELSCEVELDPALGRELIIRELVTDRAAIATLLGWESGLRALGNARPGASMRPSPPHRMPMQPGQTWLEQYLFGDGGASTAPASARRVIDETLSASFEPGNIVANTAQAVQAARVQATTSAAAQGMQRGAQAVTAGTAKTVRVNDYLALYNANNGKGTPRPRLLIKNMPLELIVARDLPSATRASRGGTNMRVLDVTAKSQQRIAAQVAMHGWDAKYGYLTRMPGASVLTFAPSALIDAANSIRRDRAGGGWTFDGRGFLVRSARSQSGNAVGFGVGLLATVGATAVIGLVGAPVVMVGLGTGLFAQVLWNAFGASDRAADGMAKALR